MGAINASQGSWVSIQVMGVTFLTRHSSQPGMMLKVSGEAEVHLAEHAPSAPISETANFKPALHQHCG